MEEERASEADREREADEANDMEGEMIPARENGVREAVSAAEVEGEKESGRKRESEAEMEEEGGGDRLQKAL